jgi:hypothetical protein
VRILCSYEQPSVAQCRLVPAGYIKAIAADVHAIAGAIASAWRATQRGKREAGRARADCAFSTAHLRWRA